MGGASFFVTTNEKETKYFNVDKNYLPKELVEVVAIPTAEEALNDKKVKDIHPHHSVEFVYRTMVTEK